MRQSISKPVSKEEGLFVDLVGILTGRDQGAIDPALERVSDEFRSRGKGEVVTITYDTALPNADYAASEKAIIDALQGKLGTSVDKLTGEGASSYLVGPKNDGSFAELYSIKIDHAGQEHPNLSFGFLVKRDGTSKRNIMEFCPMVMRDSYQAITGAVAQKHNHSNKNT